MQRIQLGRPRLLTPEQLDRICTAGTSILCELGLRVMHPRALEAASRAGLRVVADRVYPDRATVSRFLAEARVEGSKIPPARPSPDQKLRLTICQYPTHVHDLATDAVVPFTAERLIEAAKLVDVLAGENVVGGAPGCPGDAPILLQPLLQYRIQAQHCRHGRHPIDPKWARTLPYVMDMAEVLGEPIRSLPVYVVSPLTIGAESLESVLSVVDKLDRIYTGNMPSVGATTPIRIADALALGLAEVVGSAIVLHSVTDLPVSWHVAAMAFDLRGMFMTFGSPEHHLFRWATEELNAFCRGRQPGIPSGYGAMRTQAKLPGPQAATEKAAGAAAAALMGARDLDSGGALSLDEVFSAEQLIMDCEIRDHVARLVAGIDGECDPAACLEEVAAGLEGGYLSLDSTLERYRDMYWLPKLFERRSLAGWAGAGCPSLRDRAKEMARELVRKHHHQLPSELVAELDRIYEKARRELAS